MSTWCASGRRERASPSSNVSTSVRAAGLMRAPQQPVCQNEKKAESSALRFFRSATFFYCFFSLDLSLEPPAEAEPPAPSAAVVGLALTARGRGARLLVAGCRRVARAARCAAGHSALRATRRARARLLLLG